MSHTEEQFRTIYEHAPVMIDSFDDKGNCILWNKECEKNLGWTLAEVQACEDPLSLAYPDPKVRDKVLATILHADGKFREYDVLAKDGSTRTQLWADFRLPDGTLISVGHDITERKRAEKALEESEEKYRSIFNLARNGIILVDGETGEIVDCNPEFERQTGRSLEELRKFRIWELRPADEVEESKRVCREILTKGMGGSSELHWQRPDGEVVPVDFLSKIVTIAGKVYIQSVVRDITERKRAEQALRESEQKYRSIFHVAREGIVLVDGDGTMVDCNPEFEAQTGRTLAELRKMKTWELRPRQDSEKARALFERLRRDGMIDVSEQIFERPDGERVVVELRGREVALGGRTYNQAMTHDITERKEAEEELRQSRERLRALAGRLHTVREEESALIARKIHDELGQSLTALKLDIAWVGRRVAEMDNESTHPHVSERLRSMANDADETINTVRNISTQLRPVILDDMGLVKALEWQSQEFQGRTGIACSFHIDTIKNEFDPDRSTAIFRIFQEILTNVARHAEAESVQTNLRTDNGLLLLDVRDDGRGISDEEIGSPRALGILGMRERAQLCGGDLSIKRRNGKGTRVTLKIPLK